MGAVEAVPPAEAVAQAEVVAEGEGEPLPVGVAAEEALAVAVAVDTVDGRGEEELLAVGTELLVTLGEADPTPGPVAVRVPRQQRSSVHWRTGWGSQRQ